MCKLSGCDKATIKRLLPEFTLSELVAAAMSKAIVIKPNINTLTININRLIGESVKQNGRAGQMMVGTNTDKG
ncbi:MAG: hypothetical protein HRU22_13405 [Gammaproteobacteria bacterium]|nr:hypothetical protein [Gammaproteobacteria bacterium]